MKLGTHWEGCSSVHPECMKDWASCSLDARKHLKAVDDILTNYPPAQKLSPGTQLEVIEHLHFCMVELERIVAWVRTH